MSTIHLSGMFPFEDLKASARESLLEITKERIDRTREENVLGNEDQFSISFATVRYGLRVTLKLDPLIAGVLAITRKCQLGKFKAASCKLSVFARAILIPSLLPM